MSLNAMFPLLIESLKTSPVLRMLIGFVLCSHLAKLLVNHVLFFYFISFFFPWFWLVVEGYLFCDVYMLAVPF